MVGSGFSRPDVENHRVPPSPLSHPEWEIEEGGLDHLIKGTALKRLPRVAEVAHTAAFAASDHAGPMTAAVLNLSCGAIAD
jgi:3-oxoacyl-[acyl-carrier protein] reductase